MAIGILGGLVGLVISLGIPAGFTWLLARWVLGPVVRAGKQGRGHIQYRIIDFFCLVVEVQAAVAVVVAVVPAYEQTLRNGLLIYAVVSILALWTVGVTTLSRAGILDPRRRTVFNWFVLPVTTVGALVLLPLALGLAAMLISDGPKRVPAAMWIAAALLPPGLIAARPVAEWVADGAVPVVPRPCTLRASLLRRSWRSSCRKRRCRLSGADEAPIDDPIVPETP